jgi:hypothetical protein
MSMKKAIYLLLILCLTGTQYDARILATNNQKGFLGEYQPIVHYLTKAEFEALGNNLNPKNIPIWTSKK